MLMLARCCKAPLMVVSGNKVYNKAGFWNKTTICDATNEMAGSWPSPSEVVQMARR
ncbi:MAG: hypothetical protein SGPRY_004993, partial [Prymnesium sp.]